MSIVPGPSPFETTDLQFKLQCKLKVFDNTDISTFPHPYSLVACASRFGLLCIGTHSNSFQVIQTKTIESFTTRNKDVTNYPRRVIPLPSPPKHLSISCDHTILAVVVDKNQCATVIFYDVLSFIKKDIRIIKDLRLSSDPNVYVREVNWNPSIPNIFTACKSDDSLGIYELKGESVDINEIPPAAGASCFCWSPKGKQVAVGMRNGKITHYKPDLKAVKMIDAPKFDGSVALISLQWVSTYQFIGVYQQEKDGACYVVVVDAPKTGEMIFTNFDDICYSGSSRPIQFYMELQQTWNILMVGSANSSEVGVLGREGESWRQWIMLDTARAELPLSSDRDDTYPVGFGFDISSTTPLPWGESTIPPCPYLCVLSHQGVLCCYNVIYVKNGVPPVCTPPDPLTDVSGLSSFVSQTTIPSQTPLKVTPAPVVQKFVPQSTPIATRLEDAGKSLFGGQVTLTPIKPQQNTPLFPVQTATVAPPSTKTPAPPTGFNDKYSSIFASLNPTASVAPTMSKPVKPIVINATSKPVELVSKAIENKPVEIPASKEMDKAKVTVFDEANKALLNRMILDETVSLQAEIQALIKIGRTAIFDLGTEKEMMDFIEEINSLEEFVKDALENSTGQSNEIHCLKQNLLQSWAWYEEAKSQYESSSNEVVTLLIKIQPLNSVSQKRLKDIEELVFYIQSQLSQVDNVLDDQWETFQDYAKKTHRTKLPTLETIYQTMVKQNAVLQKQRYMLKDLTSRLKNKTVTLLSYVDSELSDDFQSLRLDPQNILKMQSEKVKKRSEKLTDTKVDKLKKLLRERQITQVTTTKPDMSSILEASTTKLKESMSKLNQSNTGLKTTTSFLPVNTNRPVISSLEGSAFTRFASNSGQFTAGAELSPNQSVNKPSPLSTPVVPKSTTSGFQSVPTSFSSIDGATSFTAPKSGIASIFAGIQSVIDKNVTGTVAKPASSLGSAPTSEPIKVPNTVSFVQSPTTGNLFGNTAKPLFGNIKPQSTEENVKPASSIATSDLAKTDGLFGQSTSAPSNKNLFQSAGNLTSSATGNIFGAATTTQSTLVGGAKVRPTTSSIFGSSTPFTTGDVASGFGSTPATAASTLFGSSSSLFGKTTANVSVSGSKTQPTSTSAAVFGTPQPVLSAPSTPTTFASSTTGASTTTQTPSFSTTTTAASSVVFGTTPATVTTGPSSLFATQVSSAYGTATTGASAVFGLSTSTTTTTPASSLGTTTTTAVPSLFARSTTSQPAASGTTTTTTATTGASAFGTATATQVSSVFGSTTATPPAAAFGTTTTGASSVFGTTTQPPAFGSSTTGTTSVFGTTTTTQPPAFGSTTTGTTSVFGTPTTTQLPAFGSSTTGTTSAFGTPTTTHATAFGSSTTGTTSAFGTPTTTQPTAFGSSTTGTTSAFGTPTTTQPTAFGSATTGTTSVFGTPTTTQPSAFGTPTTGATTSVFGTPTTTIQPPPAFGSSTSGTSSLFGTPTAATQPPSAFGTTTTAAAAAAPMFGATATTTSSALLSALTGSTFGSSTSPTSTTTSSMFGSNQGTTTTSVFGSASGFGQPAAFGNQPSAFGGTATAATTTTSGLFGQSSPAFGSGGGIFGAASPSAAASGGNIFGSPAPISSSSFGSGFGTTPTANAFGAPSAQKSGDAFGFGGLNVGGSNSVFGTSTSGAFGQAPPSVNPFGKTDQNSVFASNSNLFGTQNTNNSSNVFGGAPSTPMFGGSTQASGNSIFGGNSSTPAGGGGFSGSSWGSTTTSSFGSSAFGQKQGFIQPSTFGTSAFGTTATSQSTGGPFSGGGVSPATGVAQSGFGAAPSFPKPSGFGAAPVFGGGAAAAGAAPAFGAGATFGGSATFGGAPTFGSPEKVFGGGQAQAAPSGFGAPAQAAGFGNLASQNTIGFGNLAQQSNQSNSTAFSGNSSFSSWR